MHGRPAAGRTRDSWRQRRDLHRGWRTHRRWRAVRVAAPFAGLALLLLCPSTWAAETTLVDSLRDFFLSEQSNTPLFLALLMFLPLIGAPISVFCLIAGSKLGVGWGTLAIGVAMLWHLTLCYWLMHSYFKRPILMFLRRRRQGMPAISRQQQLTYCVSLVALPILPYMLKNIVVATSEFGYFRYLLITGPIQFLFSLPFITLTGAVHSANTHLLWVAALGFIAVWLTVRWFQARQRRRYPGEK